MDKRRRTRYLLAVYLIIASLAVILALIGINYVTDPLQGLILNLASEFLGVVLIFFLVNRLFALEEWNLSERIEKLANRLEAHTSFLGGETKLLKDLISESSELSLVAYSLVHVLRSEYVTFIERINAGATLRIVIVDPDSKAAQVILENSDIKDFSSDIQISLNYAKRIFEQSGKGRRGNIEVRLTSWLPSCSLTLIDASKASGLIKVVIYPHYRHSSLKDRAQFILTRDEDQYWYNKFVEQFEQIWSTAHPVDLHQLGGAIADPRLAGHGAR